MQVKIWFLRVCLSQFICFQGKWCEQVEFSVLMVKLERSDICLEMCCMNN